MEWYMVIIYGGILFGAWNSFLNYRLQKKWYDKTHPEDKTNEI